MEESEKGVEQPDVDEQSVATTVSKSAFAFRAAPAPDSVATSSVEHTFTPRINPPGKHSSNSTSNKNEKNQQGGRRWRSSSTTAATTKSANSSIVGPLPPSLSSSHRVITPFSGSRAAQVALSAEAFAKMAASLATISSRREEKEQEVLQTQQAEREQREREQQLGESAALRRSSATPGDSGSEAATPRNMNKASSSSSNLQRQRSVLLLNAPVLRAKGTANSPTAKSTVGVGISGSTSATFITGVKIANSDSGTFGPSLSRCDFAEQNKEMRAAQAQKKRTLNDLNALLEQQERQSLPSAAAESVMPSPSFAPEPEHKPSMRRKTVVVVADGDDMKPADGANNAANGGASLPPSPPKQQLSPRKQRELQQQQQDMRTPQASIFAGRLPQVVDNDGKMTIGTYPGNVSVCDMVALTLKRESANLLTRVSPVAREFFESENARIVFLGVFWHAVAQLRRAKAETALVRAHRIFENAFYDVVPPQSPMQCSVENADEVLGWQLAPSAMSSAYDLSASAIISPQQNHNQLQPREIGVVGQEKHDTLAEALDDYVLLQRDVAECVACEDRVFDAIAVAYGTAFRKMDAAGVSATAASVVQGLGYERRDAVFGVFPTVVIHTTYYALAKLYHNDLNANVFNKKFRRMLYRKVVYWCSGVDVQHVPTGHWPLPPDDGHSASHADDDGGASDGGMMGSVGGINTHHTIMKEFRRRTHHSRSIFSEWLKKQQRSLFETSGSSIGGPHSCAESTTDGEANNEHHTTTVTAMTVSARAKRQSTYATAAAPPTNANKKVKDGRSLSSSMPSTSLPAIGGNVGDESFASAGMIDISNSGSKPKRRGSRAKRRDHDENQSAHRQERQQLQQQQPAPQILPTLQPGDRMWYEHGGFRGQLSLERKLEFGFVGATIANNPDEVRKRQLLRAGATVPNVPNPRSDLDGGLATCVLPQKVALECNSPLLQRFAARQLSSPLRITSNGKETAQITVTALSSIDKFSRRIDFVGFSGHAVASAHQAETELYRATVHQRFVKRREEVNATNNAKLCQSKVAYAMKLMDYDAAPRNPERLQRIADAVSALQAAVVYPVSTGHVIPGIVQCQTAIALSEKVLASDPTCRGELLHWQLKAACKLRRLERLCGDRWRLQMETPPATAAESATAANVSSSNRTRSDGARRGNNKSSSSNNNNNGDAMCAADFAAQQAAMLGAVAGMIVENSHAAVAVDIRKEEERAWRLVLSRYDAFAEILRSSRMALPPIVTSAASLQKQPQEQQLPASRTAAVPAVVPTPMPLPPPVPFVPLLPLQRDETEEEAPAADDSLTTVTSSMPVRRLSKLHAVRLNPTDEARLQRFCHDVDAQQKARSEELSDRLDQFLHPTASTSDLLLGDAQHRRSTPGSVQASDTEWDGGSGVVGDLRTPRTRRATATMTTLAAQTLPRNSTPTSPTARTARTPHRTAAELLQSLNRRTPTPPAPATTRYPTGASFFRATKGSDGARSSPQSMRGLLLLGMTTVSGKGGDSGNTLTGSGRGTSVGLPPRYPNNNGGSNTTSMVRRGNTLTGIADAPNYFCDASPSSANLLLSSVSREDVTSVERFPVAPPMPKIRLNLSRHKAACYRPT